MVRVTCFDRHFCKLVLKIPHQQHHMSIHTLVTHRATLVAIGETFISTVSSLANSLDYSQGPGRAATQVAPAIVGAAPTID
ncbi:unnamed protein product [Linum trigynum]|uniref:Uncharacterized protein n=1 Tax=Linum trigynum TaxID=586398 RepID=A0AAV2CY32_9ROSI